MSPANKDQAPCVDDKAKAARPPYVPRTNPYREMRAADHRARWMRAAQEAIAEGEPELVNPLK